jgi:LmbE family N-acetylglucosaminyl deacetylase
MLKLQFSRPADVSYKILCLGAHADDIEIGCGGTILTLLESYPNIVCYWVVFSADQQRASEARHSADNFLMHARVKHLVIKDFRESFFPYIGTAVKEYFEQLRHDFSPDLIFTHYRNDLHQDHRMIAELTWNTFRNHLILEYEIPKYDGDLGTPNCFVPLPEPLCRKKLQYILDSFPSQHHRAWFDQETFLALLRLRGMECNAPSKYAEAFYCRKALLEFGLRQNCPHNG